MLIPSLAVAACLSVGSFASLADAARVTDSTGSPPAAPMTIEKRGLSPGQAQAIGLAATLVPVGIAALQASKQATYDQSPVLILGAGAGILVGPAIGLYAGGRPDRATRGLILRGIGAGLVGAGILAFAASFENGAGAGSQAVMALGVAGLGVVAVSGVYDLVTTPDAVRNRRGHRASFGLRPDGVLTLTTHF